MNIEAVLSLNIIHSLAKKHKIRFIEDGGLIEMCIYVENWGTCACMFFVCELIHTKLMIGAGMREYKNYDSYIMLTYTHTHTHI